MFESLINNVYLTYLCISTKSTENNIIFQYQKKSKSIKLNTPLQFKSIIEFKNISNINEITSLTTLIIYFLSSSWIRKI